MKDFLTKNLVDLATWCVHGTHSLVYHTSAIQHARTAEIAKQFGIPEHAVVALYLKSHELPNGVLQT